MNPTLTVLGALFIAVAIIGGGLRIGGVQIEKLSRRRVALLAMFGAVILIIGLYVDVAASSKKPTPPAGNIEAPTSK